MNNFDGSIALELIQKIEEGNIQDLSCAEVGVRAETIVLIATALANCSNLHTVDMCDNKLGEHGPATAKNLAQSPSIHTVYMNHNNLSSADAIKIANSFAYKNNPITLGIEDSLRGAHIGNN